VHKPAAIKRRRGRRLARQNGNFEKKEHRIISDLEDGTPSGTLIRRTELGDLAQGKDILARRV
jgi:hypothetical protein